MDLTVSSTATYLILIIGSLIDKIGELPLEELRPSLNKTNNTGVLIPTKPPDSVTCEEVLFATRVPHGLGIEDITFLHPSPDEGLDRLTNLL
jgi:hypothetical protein